MCTLPFTSFIFYFMYMCGNFMNPCQQISTILFKHLLHRNRNNFLSLIWKLLSFFAVNKKWCAFWYILSEFGLKWLAVLFCKSTEDSRVCPECERNRPAFCRGTVINAALWFWTAAEVKSRSISTGSYEMRHGSRAPMEDGLVHVVNISNQWHTFI